MKLLRNNKAFTIIEFLIAMTMFALVLMATLQSMSVFGFAKFYTTNRVELEQELHFFVEQLVSLIKNGGGIDYEEYWNRKVVSTNMSSGHFIPSTGFGNYGNGGALGTTTYGNRFYYCLSGNGTFMGTGGCLGNAGTNSGNISQGVTGGALLSQNYSGTYQRYGEFRYQFIDYNENRNSDLGDENGDASGSIIGDDDDRDLGAGPDVVGSGIYREIYLIRKNDQGRYERLLLRWVVKPDPDAMLGASCNFVGGIPTGSGCLGNIEMLRLTGEDYGMNHDGLGNTAHDGIVDTWRCHDDWKDQCTGPSIFAGTAKLPGGTDNEWVKIFPDFVNVKNIEFYVAPKNDFILSWANGDMANYIHPYVRIRVTLGFSWERKKLLHLRVLNDELDMTISTTINLNEFDL